MMDSGENEEKDRVFANFLQQEYDDAKDSKLDERRALCMKRYLGQPYGNETAGRSNHITRDVKHQVDHMLVSILEAIITSEKVVEFESENSADSDALKLATRVVHEHFFRRSNGFQVLRDAAKGGLIEVLGHVLVYHEQDERVSRAPIESEEEAILAEDAGLEIIERNDDVEAVRRETKTKFCVKYLPGNEVRVAKDAKSIEGAVYAGHSYDTTLSDLRKQGYVVPDDVSDSNDVDVGRDSARDSATNFQRAQRTGAQRSVTVHHEFSRYDYDGDGKSEIRQTIRIGSVLLLNKEVDFSLIEEWCPMPIPGRRVGESLAEVALPIEKARTTLLREVLDNYAFSNRPRIIVGQGARQDNGETLDALNNFATGAPILAKDASQISTIAVPFTGQHAFTGMEFLAHELEKLTGVTQVNQGLGADTLHDTAGGARMQAELGQQQELYVAREFAEFLCRVMAIMYRLMRDHGEAVEVMIDGEPTPVDPKTWPDVFTVTPRTGLGSGKRQSRAEARLMLLDIQRQGMEAGIPVSLEHLFYNIDGLVQDVGLGEGRHYWPTKDDAQAQPPKKSPEEMKAEADTAKAQSDMEIAQAKANQDMENKANAFAQDRQLAEHRQEADIELMNARAAAEAVLAEQKAQAEAALARQKARFEMDLAMEQAQFEARLAEVNANREADLASRRTDNDIDLGQKKAKATLPKNRPGGSVAE